MFLSALFLRFLPPPAPPVPPPTLSELADSLFRQEVTGDTLSLHYTLAEPARYGITAYPLTLPLYNREQEALTHARIENAFALLSTMKDEDFSKEERYTFSLLKDYLQTQIEGHPFALYAEPFSPSSGVQSQYPILMAEYPFRSSLDVRQYLALLSQTGDYFDSLVDFQKERAEKGFCLPDVSLEKVIAQCDTIVSEEELLLKQHFLQTTFRQRIEELITQGLITETEAAWAKAENNRILSQIVEPAYDALGRELTLLLGSRENEGGLCGYPEGKEYYRFLVKKNTGSPRSIEELYTLLKEDYTRNLSDFSLLQKEWESQNYGDALKEFPFPLTEPIAILEHLRSSQKKEFPTMEKLSRKAPEVTIKSVDSSLEEFTSPAFYLTPALDDVLHNTIYINHQQTPEGLELYTTLAHEGYPGHLYQTVYCQLYAEQKKLHPIRCLLYFGGYVEGWAIYCELLSFSYAASLYPEELRPQAELLFQMIACDRRIQLCLLSLLDIGLHYQGLSYENAKAMLQSYGISSEEACRDIYEYILEEPGNYLKYYVGYLEFLSLKEKAEALMGSAYSDLKFHEFLLKAGPSDFQNLEERLREAYSSSIPSR